MSGNALPGSDSSQVHAGIWNRRKSGNWRDCNCRKTSAPGCQQSMAGGYGVMADDGTIDYSVHEAWNEATNVYLIVILVSIGLFMYARKNKRKIMRIFTVPPTAESATEANFYDDMKKIRLRQQLEMYYIARKHEQNDSIQLTVE
ncbi:small integral membrane protein 19 isoform X1 [Xenopus tropicalis]|nr:small integral membrane protein 19 isoform X1 [Xenopus tropicalis]|eukprot:XP_012827217.1 PREDICTED: small integral membrane protein 19 isoform X1 [Xenopus tropicalis]